VEIASKQSSLSAEGLDCFMMFYHQDIVVLSQQTPSNV